MSNANPVKNITKVVTIPAINPAFVEFDGNFPVGESAEPDVAFAEDGIEFSGDGVEFARGGIKFVEFDIVLVELDGACID